MDVHHNPILNTDSYKTSHFLQYPPGTVYVNSYVEARPKEGIASEVVFFGLQMFIMEYMRQRVRMDHIDEAERVLTTHGVPFNRAGWEHIVKKHGGFLPVEIKALPEGTVVPAGTPMVQVMNTDPEVPWLTSYLETAILRAVWYPSTVATNSREVKKRIWAALLESSDDPAGQIGFKLHDFGARGTSSYEQAGIGGAAHLVNFLGTDTLSGVVFADRYYRAGVAGFSIPAAEHSTMTSWGREGEVDAYRNMLTSYPTGLVAVVSDSYDIYNAIDTIWGKTLHDEVLARDGILVVRPDSGDPVEMVLFALESLGQSFGYSRNSKGFKVLNPKVRVIQGDGVDKESIGRIIDEMLDAEWSMDNVAFGMGAGLLQHVNRDTLRFAMKASAIGIEVGNGAGTNWHEVYKDPKSDPGKTSKRGFQYVYKMDSGYVVDHSTAPEYDPADLLQTVYSKYAGEPVPTLRTTTFAEVRKRAEVV